MSDGLSNAFRLAVMAHQDQKDKAGDPYIYHVVRVADGVRRAGCEEWVQIVALLHDTVEDGHLSVESIRTDFGNVVADTVEVLTRREDDQGRWPHHDYEAYIKRVAANSAAVKVKLADLQDNLNRSRIPHPTIVDYERWGRYEWAQALLREQDARTEAMVVRY